MYRGSVVARWILVGLLTLGGGFALFEATVAGRPVAWLMLGGMALLYLSVAIVMVTSRNVGAFLRQQRNQYDSV